MAEATDTPLLRVEGLAVGLKRHGRFLNAVDGIDFHIRTGETLGLVGESGSGKSTTGLALMRLTPASARLCGRVELGGRNVLTMSQHELRRLRGGQVSMVLQDPMASLNPVFTIGDQIAEAVRGHRHANGVRAAVIELLQRVRLPAPESLLGAYPHELSGGMQQRVVGAIALAGHPQLLIADEPTTSLDVTVQAEYLKLMRSLQAELGMAMLFITHDFGVVAAMCNRVCVMYAGRIVETAPVRRLFQAPAHWYTAALIGGMPRTSRRIERLVSIPGAPPRLGDMPAGCRFAPRCGNADPRCHAQPPPMVDLGGGQRVLCWYPRNGAPGSDVPAARNSSPTSASASEASP